MSVSVIDGLSGDGIYDAELDGISDASGFNPLSYAPLLWLDPSDTSTISETVGAVTQLNDLSGNGNHVTQGNPAFQPVTGADINGLNAIDYNSNDRLSRTDAMGLTGNPSYTLFVVMQMDVTYNNDNNLFFIGDSAEAGGLLIRHAAGFLYNNGNQLFPTYDTNPHYLTYQRTTGDQYQDGLFWKDGVSQTQQSSTNPTNTPNIQNDQTVVGGIYSGGGWEGTIGELIFYNKVLTTAEITKVHNYLSAKWGI